MSEVQDEMRQVKNAEFFYEHMSMLGFSNKSRALVMAVKEAVDNGLDATEELGILPEIEVELEDIGEDLVRMTVEDNAGGIPPDEIENVYGRILYSSRFGRLKQSRGQQGIGISAVHLWAQKFQNRPTIVRSKKPEEPAYEAELTTQRKGKKVTVDRIEEVEWEKDHGTEVSIPLPANWRSRPKLQEYVEGTALANPSARITYIERGDKSVYERSHDEPLEQPEEMRPHPNAADTGLIDELLGQTDATQLNQFLQQEFHKLDTTAARRIIRKTDLKPDNPLIFDEGDIEDLVKAMRSAETYDPSDKSLSPLGSDLVKKTLESYNPEFIGIDERELITVEGHPTKIETGIAYGGDITGNDQADYYRVANRVPLVYDSSACALQHAAESVEWDKYELDQDASGNPLGPAVIFVHICSTQIKFGNEAKTYVAENETIKENVRVSLQKCGREFSTYLRDKKKRRTQKRKVERMIPIYTALNGKLAEVAEGESDRILSSIGKSCSTVVVDDRSETPDVVRNPTEKRRTVEIDGEEVTLSPGDETEYNESVDYHFYPVHTSEL